MHRIRLLIGFMGVVAALSPIGAAQAQWQRGGVTLSAALDNQSQTAVVPDGLGGAIVAWYDTRNGTTSIYAQRISAAGVPLWTTDGAAVCTAGNTQDHPQIVSDGAGGAIITWEDRRTGAWDIYAQRLNASGVPQWTSNGVAVCSATNNQEIPQILADGVGGAFIVWPDNRSGTNYDLYGARVTSAGNVLWGTNGAAICTAAGNQTHNVLLPDGAGGLLVAWEDYRAGVADIYIQLVSASGLWVWTVNGIPVCTATGNQFWPQIVTDGAGGAIVAWEDWRTLRDVYVQRINSVGVPWWTPDGMRPNTFNFDNTAPAILPDGQGGVFVAWQQAPEVPPPTPWSVLVQRINSAGVRLWQPFGVPVSTAGTIKTGARLAPDGEGGIIVAWHDKGNPTVGTQRIDGSGTLRWESSGALRDITYGNKAEIAIVPDGIGGSILTWIRDPSDVGYDVSALRIDNVFGFWGHPEPVITSAVDVPADQGGKVKINWNASDQDRDGVESITHYSVWRATDAASVSAANVVADPSAIPPQFNGLAYYRERTPTLDYYWEWIANQGAVFDRHYSFAADTRADSVAADLSVHQFRVVAHTADEFVLFKSLPAFGYSVDNLAPPAPLFLTAQRVGSDVQLRWNRAVAPDLRDYSLYRATSSGVTPVPINFLESAEDTVAVDANAPSSALYYIVTAFDVHANQGPPSNEASVGALTDVGNAPSITALTVLQNHPNPFTATTDFEVGLPTASDVSIEVFDVAGRRVSLTELAGVRGWQRVPFAGRDPNGKPLASGVYFYRVMAAGSTITRKMVIAR